MRLPGSEVLVMCLSMPGSTGVLLRPCEDRRRLSASRQQPAAARLRAFSSLKGMKRPALMSHHQGSQLSLRMNDLLNSLPLSRVKSFHLQATVSQSSPSCTV